MSSNKLKYYSLGLVFLLSFQSCISTKKQIVTEKNLVVVTSYYQELIPGQANQKTKYNLYIELESSLDIIDSVSFHNEIKYLFKRKNYYETDLGREMSKKGEEVVIFYHNNEKLFKTSFQKIVIKEPLYLP